MSGFDLRHALIAAGIGAISALRLDRMLAPLAAGAGVAFTFHRVRPPGRRSFAPNAALEVSPTTLAAVISAVAAAGIEPICIDDVPKRLAGGRRFAVFTFDDGYRDNLDIAAPLLRRMGVPWTLFAVPGLLDRTTRAWWLELEVCLTTLEWLPLFDPTYPSKTSPNLRVRARDPAAKTEAFAMIRKILYMASEVDRTIYCSEICRMAGIDTVALVSEVFAGTADLAALLASGDVTLGSHTSSHAVLTRCSRDDAEHEITDSRARLTKQFERKVRHLAFPHGDAGSCSSRDQDLAEKAGYTTAWTTRPAHLQRSDRKSLYALPRVTMNGLHASPSMARSVISGIPFLPATMLRPFCAQRSMTVGET